MPKSLPREGHPSKLGRSGMASTSGEIREAPLLAITREGPWLWTACYQLRPWPRRLDLSISQCLLFCNSEKKGSSWLILGSSSCVVSLLGVINNSIKISQCTRQAALDRGWKGLAQEVPEGPAMGPCPITPTQSWNVFDFSSRAYMCLPSDTMLAVILARKHVWCSHPMGGSQGGTDGTAFQAN